MNFYIVKGERLVEDKKQKWICIAIGLFLCFPSLNSAIGSIIKFFLGTQFKLGTYVIYAIYYLVMLYALYKNIRRISVSTFAITVFRNPQNFCVNATPINQLPRWPARQA